MRDCLLRFSNEEEKPEEPILPQMVKELDPDIMIGNFTSVEIGRERFILIVTCLNGLSYQFVLISMSGREVGRVPLESRLIENLKLNLVSGCPFFVKLIRNMCIISSPVALDVIFLLKFSKNKERMDS